MLSAPEVAFPFRHWLYACKPTHATRIQTSAVEYLHREPSSSSFITEQTSPARYVMKERKMYRSYADSMLGAVLQKAFMASALVPPAT